MYDGGSYPLLLFNCIICCFLVLCFSPVVHVENTLLFLFIIGCQLTSGDGTANEN